MVPNHLKTSSIVIEVVVGVEAEVEAVDVEEEEVDMMVVHKKMAIEIGVTIILTIAAVMANIVEEVSTAVVIIISTEEVVTNTHLTGTVVVATLTPTLLPQETPQSI